MTCYNAIIMTVAFLARHYFTSAFVFAVAVSSGVGASVLQAADDENDKAKDAEKADKAAEEEEVKNFPLWDYDKDGEVTAMEFVRAHKAVAKRGETVDLAALKKKFVAMDVNEDETLSEIEVDPPKPVAAPASPKGSAPKKASAPKPTDT